MIVSNFSAFDAANQVDTIQLLLKRLQEGAHCSEHKQLDVFFSNIQSNLEQIKNNACHHFVQGEKEKQ